MTVKIPSYLQKNRYGIFYFRRAIPHSLRKHAGRTEVVCSLRTREPRQAVRQSRKVAILFDNWLEALEDNVAKKKGSNTFRADWTLTLEKSPDGTETRKVESSPDDIRALKEAGLSSRDIAEIITKGELTPAQVETPNRESSPQPTSATSPSLSELYDAYVRDRTEAKAREWKPSDTESSKIRRLIEILGDIPCDEVDKTLAKHVRAKVKQLPCNSKPYEGMTVSQILKVIPKTDERLSPTSIKHHLDFYRGLFNWAIDNSLRPAPNPFSGVRIDGTTPADKKRDMFDADDLKNIFAGPIFSDYGKGEADEPFMYWGPLIGLFTGARLGEITSLYLDDLRSEGGVQIFDINVKAEEKRVKSDSGHRLIPIHPELIRLGLLHHRDQLRKKDALRLFPELALDTKKTYGRKLSEWFSDYLDDVGVYVKWRKTFHSFRHTFTTELYRLGLQEVQVERLCGRKPSRNQGTGRLVYDKGDTLETLKGTICKVDFSDALIKVKPFEANR